jgi:RHS repeat-associated protein
VQSLNYGFDAAGDLKTIDDNVLPARNQALDYDALYRLTQASGIYGTYTYGYDADNNRTALSLTSTGNSYSATYGYAANSNQLQSVTQGTSVRNISYTANGNTQQDQFGSGQVFTYTYNQDNRLIQASLGGVPQASYTQNYLGQRVIKAEGTAATHFHYDRGGHLIAESDGSGNVQREYVFLDDTPIAFITPGGIDFIHPNHLGTPQKMTDASQNVVWDGGGSDPFMMSPPPTTPAMGLRFPGQYYDSETGLHYNYFRDYDPSLGRYTESDPIGLEGGVNTYAYVGGNPVNHADPIGLWTAQLGFTFNVGAFQFGTGVAIDGNGNIGTYLTEPRGGIGSGGYSGGATFGASNASTICDLGGLFANASAGAGAGLDGSVGAFFGASSDGPVIGGEVNYGIGFSGGVSANFTDTTVKMLGHL